MSFHNPAEVREFVLAGNATITLESQRTGKHYTYRVRQASEGKQLWFVSLLTGPDNEGDYTYLGIIDSSAYDFRLTAKSRLAPDAAPVAGFQYMWSWIKTDRLPPQMDIHHEGRCGRCGRALTVPESIERGIGPECFARMGG